jgi:hypothetical protein
MGGNLRKAQNQIIKLVDIESDLMLVEEQIIESNKFSTRRSPWRSCSATSAVAYKTAIPALQI